MLRIMKSWTWGWWKLHQTKVVLILQKFCCKHVYIFWTCFSKQGNKLYFQSTIGYLWAILSSAVSRNFWGGCWLLTSIARRKAVVQLGSLGWHCRPSPVGPRGKTLEFFGYFAFWIAQNITLLALERWRKLTPEISTFEDLGVWVWDPKLVY